MKPSTEILVLKNAFEQRKVKQLNYLEQFNLIGIHKSDLKNCTYI